MPEKYYITTAISYPNSLPHIGHMLEFVQADFLARYQRMMGKDVHFLTGTDEHGQKNVEAAEKVGMNVQDFVNKNSQIFQDFTKLLNMSNDDFIKTSDKQKHWPSVIKLWKAMAEKGDIYKKAYEGLYCVGCEKFITQKELDEQGNCPNHGKPPKTVKEENYFFKLSTYAKQVKDLIEKDELHVYPKTRKNEIISFLDGDVHDISFSRHKDALTWGIPVPDDDEQVMYVWCDALTNYMSALDYANDSEQYKKYWPADVHMIGKDILRFHAGYWPAMHLSAGVPPPKRVFAHGFVNNKGQKMSKTLGNVIDPYEQIKKYGVEPVRLYLLKELPSTEDGDYDEDLVIETLNSELADDLGNLLRRIVVLIEKNFQGKIPKQGQLEEVDKQLIQDSHFHEKFHHEMNEFEFNKALWHLWAFVKATNKYLSDTEPWKINDKDRLGTVLYNALESLRIIAHYLYPAMPTTAENILSQLGQKKETLQNLSFNSSTQGSINKAEILFKKYEKTQETFPLNLKVAKVESIKDHPNADKLYVMRINLGEETRQLVAGLKDHYTKEELQDKHLIVITNLKYAKLRGVESQGMLLAGDDGEVVETLTTDEPAGTPVGVEGMESEHKPLSFEQFQKLTLTVKNGKPHYQDKEIKVNGKEITLQKVKDGSRIR